MRIQPVSQKFKSYNIYIKIIINIIRIRNFFLVLFSGFSAVFPPAKKLGFHSSQIEYDDADLDKIHPVWLVNYKNLW